MAKAIAMHVCLLAFFSSQGAITWHHPGCLITRCYCEGPGSLIWRDNSRHFAVLWHDHRGTALYSY